MTDFVVATVAVLRARSRATQDTVTMPDGEAELAERRRAARAVGVIERIGVTASVLRARCRAAMLTALVGATAVALRGRRREAMLTLAVAADNPNTTSPSDASPTVLLPIRKIGSPSNVNNVLLLPT